MSLIFVYVLVKEHLGKVTFIAAVMSAFGTKLWDERSQQNGVPRQINARHKLYFSSHHSQPLLSKSLQCVCVSVCRCTSALVPADKDRETKGKEGDTERWERNATQRERTGRETRRKVKREKEDKASHS